MALSETIAVDFKEALKSKDELLVSVLRMLQAAVKTREFEKRVKLSKAEKDESKLSELSRLTDEEYSQTIASEAKKRKDSIEQYEKGGRPELAEREKKELEILSAYLPAQMGEEELRKIIKEAIAESGVSDIKEIGKLMAILMSRVKGKADGGMVQKIVREELEK